ncbi:universal stress protein [Sneathiella limimaris]|uniref:universal stress protein n=1 Tax=Sneathiella limimaris TaxID=1964213 RepID=UPI00146D7D02|nr:universal stress protein [Sneathiella limimaris]
MTIKSILLHLTNTDALEKSVSVALGLATENGASIKAVYSVLPATPPTSFMGYIPPELIEQTRAVETKAAEEAVAKVKDAAAKVDVPLETVIEEGYALDIINKHALAVDLVVIGQVDSDDEKASQYQYLADELVVTCPQPVLTVPYAGNFSTFGKHVLVGWNNTREAAKAVHYALPFLQKAEKVTLLSVNPDRDETNENASIIAHLKRHGVDATMKVGHWKDIGVGNALLDTLVDLNADMLVMGAYGHSRIREMILGGATQEILNHMTAPIMFAH